MAGEKQNRWSHTPDNTSWMLRLLLVDVLTNFRPERDQLKKLMLVELKPVLTTSNLKGQMRRLHEFGDAPGEEVPDDNPSVVAAMPSPSD